MHPVWVLGPTGVDGWVTTRRTPVKVRHLAGNPHVTCAYLAPDHDAAFFDGVASWAVGDERRLAWEVCLQAPPPVGFDPATIWPDGPASPDCGVLRLTASRIVATPAGRPGVRWQLAA